MDITAVQPGWLCLKFGFMKRQAWDRRVGSSLGVGTPQWLESRSPICGDVNVWARLSFPLDLSYAFGKQDRTEKTGLSAVRELKGKITDE